MTHLVSRISNLTEDRMPYSSRREKKRSFPGERASWELGKGFTAPIVGEGKGIKILRT